MIRAHDVLEPKLKLLPFAEVLEVLAGQLQEGKLQSAEHGTRKQEVPVAEILLPISAMLSAFRRYQAQIEAVRVLVRVAREEGWCLKRTKKRGCVTTVLLPNSYALAAHHALCSSCFRCDLHLMNITYPSPWWTRMCELMETDTLH